jgi:hypothetical protein
LSSVIPIFSRVTLVDTGNDRKFNVYGKRFTKF